MEPFSKLDKTSYKHSTTRSLSIALIGLGAIGSEIARLLGLLGVGAVALVDNGLTESVNSSQNIFFRKTSSLSRPKAEVIANEGLTYFPQTRWISLPSEVADVGFGDLLTCSLIFSATDSALARVETAYVARRLNIPMVDAGLLGSAYWRGRTAWHSAEQNAACYFCQLTENRRAEILSLSRSPVLRCQWVEENTDVPATPPMSSVIAGMAIDLAFRHGLLAQQRQSVAWDIHLGDTPQLQVHALTRSATCPFHDFPGKSELLALPHHRPFEESLRANHLVAIELDWPVAVNAACAKCGHSWSPMRRIAWVRRHSHCPNCGASSHFRLEAVSRIAVGDSAAQHSPADFSFSETHLYSPVYHNGRKQS